MNTKSKTESWEKEFMSIFVHTPNSSFEDEWKWKKWADNPVEVLTFIRSLLAQQREEIKEKIRGKTATNPPKNDLQSLEELVERSVLEGSTIGYNTAINDILKEL